MTQPSSPDRSFNQPSPEEVLQQASQEFVRRTEAWLQEALQALSSHGIELQHPVRVVHAPELEPILPIGVYMSLPELGADVTYSTNDERNVWHTFFDYWNIPVSAAALDQIRDIIDQNDPRRSIAAPELENTIFIHRHAGLLHELMKNPDDSGLRLALLESLWFLIESEHSLSEEHGMRLGTRRWSGLFLQGKSPVLGGDVPDSSFGLNVHHGAQLVQEMVASEPDPLKALLDPEVRARILDRYQREISPRLETIQRQHVVNFVDGAGRFDWFLSAAFRSFRHQPSLQTFCEGLKNLGYEILAHELELQPGACQAMIQALTRMADEYMEDFRYSPEDIQKAMAKIQEASERQDLQALEDRYRWASGRLSSILRELGVVHADEFAKIDEEQVPEDLRPLLAQLLQVEPQLIREEPPLLTEEYAELFKTAIAKLQTTPQGALEPLSSVEPAEFPDYGELENIVMTLLDFWKDVEVGNLEDAEALREGFSGEPFEISIENVRNRLEELKSYQGSLIGDKDDYLQRLEKLLAHLASEKNPQNN